MVKTLVSLTSRQMEILKEEADKLQIPKSELLRRIMDKYFEGNKKVTLKEVRTPVKSNED